MQVEPIDDVDDPERVCEDARLPSPPNCANIKEALAHAAFNPTIAIRKGRAPGTVGKGKASSAKSGIKGKKGKGAKGIGSATFKKGRKSKKVLVSDTMAFLDMGIAETTPPQKPKQSLTDKFFSPENGEVTPKPQTPWIERLRLSNVKSANKKIKKAVQNEDGSYSVTGSS